MSKPTTKKHKCPYDGMVFVTASALVWHIRHIHIRQPYECSHSGCDFIAETKKELTDHVRQDHTKSTTKKLGRYVCPFDDIAFVDPELLVAHILRLHIVESVLKCPFSNCDCVTETSKELAEHIYQHHLEERLEGSYAC